MAPTDFAKALSHYLGVYLPGQRNLSTNTLKSYRDTFKLFLHYCKQDCHLAIEKLCLRHIDKQLILGFLQWLEQDRHNGVSTRNQRLACLHGFYQYLQLE
ncbi:MAG: site-specific integrase, partial [Gammaproteobacteria bacterium]